MFSVKLKFIAVGLSLVLFTCIFATGCGKKQPASWVNTQSMPGHTFKKHSPNSPKSQNSSAIVYLGSDNEKVDFNTVQKDAGFNVINIK